MIEFSEQAASSDWASLSILIAMILAMAVIVSLIALTFKADQNDRRRKSGLEPEKYTINYFAIGSSLLCLVAAIIVITSLASSKNKYDEENVKLVAQEVEETQNNLQEEFGVYTNDELDLKLFNPSLAELIEDKNADLEFRIAPVVEALQVKIDVGGSEETLVFEGPAGTSRDMKEKVRQMIRDDLS